MLEALTDYLYTFDLTVSKGTAYQADLIFCYVPLGSVGCFSKYKLPDFSDKALFFSLRETNEYDQHVVNGGCPFEAGVIYRDMSIISALNLVISAMGRQTLISPFQCTGEKTCVSSSGILSPRQQDVVICIKRGMALGEIARELNINIKTVSSHKTAIMRKMGFKRNHELYHWLNNSPGFEINKLTPNL
ncbi:response regulator transcription factor [Serratia nematodiphila]|uniref:response regulator transcription factor n=1 Tax=Serratia nematodiphila TaxID=458197 RepID=UPI0015769E60|nr:LuxR C-terminal-related transcriptional regulator [Serratia nematodiphila]UTO00470.1 LuxR C-terminal-related transcriptional regulator [Serratia nematodiphila]